MNLESVIVCAVCLIAIALVGYYMHSKVSTQNDEILKLTKRCEAMEMLLSGPPPPDDLHSMFTSKQQSKQCESSMCDLEPLRIEANDEELDNIVETELSKMELQKKELKDI
jgi:hypothetical protein